MKDKIIDDDWISKSEKKREADYQEDLGLKLLKIDPRHWPDFPLSENLFRALEAYLLIVSSGAAKRQRQLIGKIMRHEDCPAIEAAMHKVKLVNTKPLSRVSILTLQVQEGDIEEALAENSRLERQKLRQLLRNWNKSVDSKKDVALKALRRYLAENLSQ